MKFSKDNILRLTNNGLDVFEHYISVPFRVGKNFLNPLYEDTKASCNVYLDRKTGAYKIKDFGNEGYSGDCFDYAGRLFGLDCYNSKEFVEIMRRISDDLGLNMTSSNSTHSYSPKAKNGVAASEVKPRPYTTVRSTFTKTQLSWWRQYGISEAVLKRYNVVSLSCFESTNKDGKPFKFMASDAQPIYAYVQNKHIKLYRPLSKCKHLHAGEMPKNYCFDLEQLPAKGDLLFITGGEKDVMSLAARRFSAICFNSETSNIPPEIIRSLAHRFRHIVLLFDVDKTGMESSQKQQELLKSFDVKRLLLPLSGTKTEKDISDYFKLGMTAEDLRRLFVEYLDSLYEDTLSLLKSCEVNMANPPPQAVNIVSVNGVPLGTQGNLLCITGAEGTGKSNYAAALVAGAVRQGDVSIDTLGLCIAENIKNKAVLFYDTEQSEAQLFKNVSKLMRRAELKALPSFCHVFSLTGLTRTERLNAIVRSMDKYYYLHQGIHMVVIDGIADLILSANGEAESVAVVESLYRLAGIYNTCIVTVLHFIPNGLKLRGHLGSELQRKASAILSVESDKQPGMSVVKALKVREGSPLDVPLMLFSWDKAADMHLYRGEKSAKLIEVRKEKTLAQVAKEVFSEVKELSYTLLTDLLQENVGVKERTAKSYISFMLEKDIIGRSEQDNKLFILKSENKL